MTGDARLKALYRPVFAEIKALLEGSPVIVAIDGRCGSGKSTLGRVLEAYFSCNLVHMDDFYLPPDERREDWMEVPAGNMDLERFRREVLEPLTAGQSPIYRPYRCQTGTFGDGHVLPQRPLTVVEGSYSHHPCLADCYHLRIFVTCSQEEQVRRLRERERDEERLARFQTIWAPLEERYFQTFAIEEQAHLVVDTSHCL